MAAVCPSPATAEQIKHAEILITDFVDGKLDRSRRQQREAAEREHSMQAQTELVAMLRPLVARGDVALEAGDAAGALQIYLEAQAAGITGAKLQQKLIVAEASIPLENQELAMLTAAATAAGAEAAAAVEAAKASSAGDALPRFATPFDDWTATHSIASLQALKLMDFQNAVRDKADWAGKLQKAEVVQRWRVESQLLAREFEFSLMELHWAASRWPGPCRPAGAEGVFAADGLVTDDEHQALLIAAAALERAQELCGCVDWHPGSDGLVRDLVHPSLYCYRRGVSAQLTHPWPREKGLEGSIGGGAPADDTATAMVAIQGGNCRSALGLAWLPADFAVAEDGTVTVDSYINNLHPREHPKLYTAIASIFSRCVPLLEETLSFVSLSSRLRDGEPTEHFFHPVTGKPCAPFEDEDGYEPDTIQPMTAPAKDFLNALPANSKISSRGNAQPRPAVLRGRKLQVIVKMASIELTPQQPVYHGGAWHVEGMADDGIVATAIYYYDEENIRGSSLAFRVAVESPPQAEQSDYLTAS